jgi:hypothetical protein
LAAEIAPPKNARPIEKRRVGFNCCASARGDCRADELLKSVWRAAGPRAHSRGRAGIDCGSHTTLPARLGARFCLQTARRQCAAAGGGSSPRGQAKFEQTFKSLESERRPSRISSGSLSAV